MRVYFRKVFSFFGIDAAIAFTLLSRIIPAGGSLLSIVFIARFLSAAEQGYYYTFGSIIALQVFFELGLSGIITQYTAHEFAHLKYSNGELIGEDNYKSRLASLLHFCVKWFGIISLLLFVMLVIAGFCFFSKFNTHSNVEWKTPWIIICAATSLNLFIDPILAYFDGLNEVKDMARVRLVQKTSMIILLFLFLMLGFKLYSSAVASILSIIINYFQIFASKRRNILKTIWSARSKWKVDYMTEIFPYQWRIAISWISGYFIFQLFNPVLFATEGAKVAGQMGMTLQVLNGLSSLSMSWISTKIPLFSGLISKKQYNELDNIFNKTLKNVNLVNTTLLLLFIGGIVALDYFRIPLRDRFLPIFSIGCLSLTVFINQFIFSWATYLRCHKQEPLLLQAVVSAIYCSLSTYIFGRLYGLNGIVLGYTVWAFVSIIWVYRIFVNNRRKLHFT